MRYVYIIILVVSFFIIVNLFIKLQEKTCKAANEYSKYLIEQGF